MSVSQADDSSLQSRTSSVFSIAFSGNTAARALRVRAGGRDDLRPTVLTGGPVELRGGERREVTPPR